VFATYPVFDSPLRNFLSEFLATAVLLLGVRALTDRRNAAPGGYVEPLALGALVWAIGLSLGGLTGYAINPARDLGPRLASAVMGWGTAVFQSHGGYFWIPIVAPLAGGLAGIFLYDLAIHRHLPPEGEPSPPGELSP
jgi:glycerol uptake facilitator-like aquaporin